MVSKEDGCFVCSRWTVIIVSGIFALIGVITILAAIAAFANPNNDPGLNNEVGLQFLLMGVIYIAFGAYGIYGGYNMKYISMFVFAIIASICLALSILSTLYIASGNNQTEIYFSGGTLLFIPLVICSWVVVSGLKS